MPFLKQTFMWLFFIVAMYLGGASTQSSSNMLQGMGFVSIVMALICLYIIFKLMWRARGTITTIVVISGIAIYSSYALGLFGNKTVEGIITGKPSPVQKAEDSEEQLQEQQQKMDSLDAQLFDAGTEDENNENSKAEYRTEQTVIVKQEANNVVQQQSAKLQINNGGGLVGKVKTLLFGEQNNGQNSQTASTIKNMDINPFDYPAVTGYARVVTASTLFINGLNIKMYGVDAPDINQTCANHFGQGYYCGKEARNWLQSWLGNKEVTCHILGKVENRWATGTCFIDNNKYDVGAVVINAGWAVAYTKNTDIYIGYENQAKANKRGLWAGTFYKPWDWRKIQNRKVDVKVEYKLPKPAAKKKNSFDFWGLF
ncbi:MAG: thermonuclease family protein [Alphaproteobacteria bacterium]|nr:thermonuclease family protein [Alphaproteobacteria bacterium]